MNADQVVYNQQFSVSFDYPVVFTEDVFDTENSTLCDVINRLDEGRKHKAVVYIDSGVAQANPQIISSVKNYFHEHESQIELAGEPAVVTGGETIKTDYNLLRDVIWNMGNLHLDRQSFVIAIGGGSMLDAIGFAVSLVHRGMRLIRIPSTVLAQNDAGVGVKNGFDEHGQKNFIGTFAPPFAVIDDFSLLRTLPDLHWQGGIAEAFKVAIIKDATFFRELCANASALKKRDHAAMKLLIKKCAILHLEHIATLGDPFEFGTARPLDFGHWSAHRLEALSNYKIGHGQAVAVGIALDSFYAMRKKMISQQEFDAIISAFKQVGLPIWCEQLGWRTVAGELEVLAGLDQFREHLGGRLTITLPDSIGKKIEVHHIDCDVIVEGVSYLKKISMQD